MTLTLTFAEEVLQGPFLRTNFYSPSILNVASPRKGFYVVESDENSESDDEGPLFTALSPCPHQKKNCPSSSASSTRDFVEDLDGEESDLPGEREMTQMISNALITVEKANNVS